MINTCIYIYIDICVCVWSPQSRKCFGLFLWDKTCLSPSYESLRTLARQHIYIYIIVHAKTSDDNVLRGCSLRTRVCILTWLDDACTLGRALQLNFTSLFMSRINQTHCSINEQSSPSRNIGIPSPSSQPVFDRGWLRGGGMQSL